MKKLIFFVITAFFLVRPSAGVCSQEKIRLAILPFSWVGDPVARQLAAIAQEEVTDLLYEQDGLELFTADRVAAAVPGVLTIPRNKKLLEEVIRKTRCRWLLGGLLSSIGFESSLDLQLLPADDLFHPKYTYFSFRQKSEIGTKLPDVLAGLLKQISKSLVISDIKVKGNRRIDADAIKRKIGSKKGGLVSRRLIQKDIKNIFKMGFFDQVEVTKEETPDGIVLIYRVVERPYIRKIEIKGASKVDEKDIKEAMKVKTYQILDEAKITKDLEAIKSLYQSKGYFRADVSYEVKPVKGKEKEQVDLIIKIVEGKKFFVEKIRFVGNRAIPEKALKKAMKTKEKGFLWWLTTAGFYKKNTLEEDVLRLTEFYATRGFIEAKIGEPEVKVVKNHLEITIPINEGDQYYIGSVKVKGVPPEEAGEIMKKTLLQPGEIFNRILVNKEIQRIKDHYADRGYAFAEVDPVVEVDRVRRVVNLNLNVEKGNIVKVEKIEIEGNTKTRDRVIRRELAIAEGDTYSGLKVRNSMRNLHRLNFFEDVEIKREKGMAPDALRLKVKVREKQTGAFSIAMGYSSIERVFGLAKVGEENFLGLGWKLSLMGEISKTRHLYQLSFTEPRFMDSPLSVGFDIFDTEKDYDTYEKWSKGGRVRFGYLFSDDFRGFLHYTYERTRLTDIEPSYTQALINIYGEEYLKSGVTSAVTVGAVLDRRDNIFLPTSGYRYHTSLEVAGPGGDFYYWKLINKLSYNHLLPADMIFGIRFVVGYAEGYEGRDLPVFERFKLGGMFSLRGFDSGSVGPKDPSTGEVVGGNSEAFANVELLLPLVKKAKFYGLVFLDAGNAYNDFENFTDVRSSFGAGVRWLSPIGPIRLEWGHVINPLPGERKSNWEFLFGGFF